MTKKQLGMLESYRRATAEELSDVYTRWSNAKERAWDYCESLRQDLNGYDARIPSANTFQFTYAFKYVEEGKLYLCYVTAANESRFCIEEE